jgi:phosphoglycolate phosphatase-like HAD superfamily hydrolase
VNAARTASAAVVPDLAALRSYNGVVFDCDGVLLDSNTLKIDAFRQVLVELGFDAGTTSAFSQFQATHFGTSRHRLFDMLLEGRFGPVPAVAKQQLLDGYGGKVSQGYLTVPEAADLRVFLGALRGHVPLYIVSGSDEAELREVCDKRGIAGNFAAIYGSPSNKVENLRRTRDHIAAAGGRPERLIFFGDADADADAAKSDGADFVFVSRFSTVREAMTMRAEREGFATVETLDIFMLPVRSTQP